MARKTAKIRKAAPERAALATATPERLQHGPVHIEVRERDPRGQPITYGLKAKGTCPLDAYLIREVITWRQHDAGAWLARMFRRAVHMPSITAHYGERLGGGGGADPAVDARRIIWKALIRAGLAEQAPEALLEIRPAKTKDTPHIADIKAPVRLLPAGHVAMNVCGLESWAGGTLKLNQLRSALDALADVLKIPRA